jgi:hypothetical protein
MPSLGRELINAPGKRSGQLSAPSDETIVHTRWAIERAFALAPASAYVARWLESVAWRARHSCSQSGDGAEP